MEPEDSFLLGSLGKAGAYLDQFHRVGSQEDGFIDRSLMLSCIPHLAADGQHAPHLIFS